MIPGSRAEASTHSTRNHERGTKNCRLRRLPPQTKNGQSVARHRPFWEGFVGWDCRGLARPGLAAATQDHQQDQQSGHAQRILMRLGHDGEGQDARRKIR